MPVYPGAPPHFFPPRPEVVVQQQDANGLSTDPRHQFPFDGFFSYEPNAPPRLPFWRIAADHRDDALFLVGVQYFIGTGALLLIQVGSRIWLGPFRASNLAHLDIDIMPQLTAAVFGQPGESGAWRRPTGGAV